jgi:hypothetical protein
VEGEEDRGFWFVEGEEEDRGGSVIALMVLMANMSMASPLD